MTLLSVDCASPDASAASCCVSSPRCPATAHANVSSRRFLQWSRAAAGRSSYRSDAAKPANTSVTFPDIQFSLARRFSRRSRIPRSTGMHRNTHFSAYDISNHWVANQPTLLAFEGGDDVVRHRLDFAPSKTGRMRLRRHVLSEFSGRKAAAPVVVGVFVKVWHLRGGPCAGDHL